MEITVEILLIFSALALSGLGIIGCIAPGLPGPPISYAAILVYHFGRGNVFDTTFLIVSLIFVVAVSVMDYVMPAYATKKFGGTNKGIWGGIIGLVLGVILFPPWGIILGPLVGAIIGDLVAGKQFESALRSGFGAFVGFIVATSLKLFTSITLTVYLVIKMIQVNVFG